MAIADELRRLHPDLEIDWLAQHPVTTFLAARGERIHPASAELASESGHIEGECADHDLHCFQAWRRMDEILLANFMVFHDIVDEDPYDLWIGDEAWELDYYLHENPEQKRAAYAWLTDFVGWLPMPDGGQREASLTADYNAEMIEHIARYPRVRDRAIFVGAPEDIVPDRFGPGLPAIRGWTEAHYDFSGDYITGFDPADLADRDAIRAELGYARRRQGVHRDRRGLGRRQRTCCGGSSTLPRRPGSGRPRPADGRRRRAPHRPAARCRPTTASRSTRTCMTCTAIWPSATWPSSRAGSRPRWNWSASNRPFLYFPLGHHFEQTFHVPHRLARYGAGRRMDYATADPRGHRARPSPPRSESRSPTARSTPEPSAGSRARSPRCCELRCPAAARPGNPGPG